MDARARDVEVDAVDVTRVGVGFAEGGTERADAVAETGLTDQVSWCGVVSVADIVDHMGGHRERTDVATVARPGDAALVEGVDRSRGADRGVAGTDCRTLRAQRQGLDRPAVAGLGAEIEFSGRDGRGRSTCSVGVEVEGVSGDRSDARNAGAGVVDDAVRERGRAARVDDHSLGATQG